MSAERRKKRELSRIQDHLMTLTRLFLRDTTVEYTEEERLRRYLDLEQKWKSFCAKKLKEGIKLRIDAFQESCKANIKPLTGIKRDGTIVKSAENGLQIV